MALEQQCLLLVSIDAQVAALRSLPTRAISSPSKSSSARRSKCRSALGIDRQNPNKRLKDSLVFYLQAQGLGLRQYHRIQSKENDMSERTLTFKLLGHTKRADGLIGRYHLEVTDPRSDQVPLEILIHSQTQPKNSLVRRAFSYLPDAKSPARSWAYLLLLPHL